MEPLPPYPEVPRVIPGEKPSRFFLWVGLIAGALVVAVVIAGFFTIRLVASSLPQDPSGPSDPSFTIPVECAGACLSDDDALSLVPGPDALAALGGATLMEGDKPGSRLSVGEVYSTATFQYSEGKGEPFGCSFALATGPVTSASVAMSESMDEPMIGLGSYGTDESFLLQTVRVFRDTAAADSYPATLRDSLIRCPHYSVKLDGVGQWTTDVTQVQFGVAHLAVDAVAWREASGGFEYTVVDLVYANLAVRTMFSSTEGRSISDEQFAAFVLETSRALYALDPIEEIADQPCSGVCYTFEDAATLVPASAALEQLGTSTGREGYVVTEPQPLGSYADDAHGTFYLGNGDPISCEFVLSPAPMTLTNPGSYNTRNDTIVDLGAYGGEASVTQSVQIFESTLWADRYLPSVDSGVKRCAHVDVNLPDLGHYIADLDSHTFTTSSDKVTAAGWVETSSDLRRTVVDLRYANLVVRTVFTEPSDGSGFTDEQIAAFVLETSKRLEALG